MSAFPFDELLPSLPESPSSNDNVAGTAARAQERATALVVDFGFQMLIVLLLSGLSGCAAGTGQCRPRVAWMSVIRIHAAPGAAGRRGAGTGSSEVGRGRADTTKENRRAGLCGGMLLTDMAFGMLMDVHLRPRLAKRFLSSRIGLCPQSVAHRIRPGPLTSVVQTDVANRSDHGRNEPHRVPTYRWSRADAPAPVDSAMDDGYPAGP